MSDRKAEQVFRFIESYLNERGYAPAIWEIAEGCGCTRSTVNECLHHLHLQRRVRLMSSKVRSLQLVSA